MPWLPSIAREIDTTTRGLGLRPTETLDRYSRRESRIAISFWLAVTSGTGCH